MFRIDLKKPTHLTIIGEVILPLLLALVCQFLSIGKGFDFNLNVLFLNYVLWSMIFLFFISIFKSHRIGLIFYILFFFLFTLTNRYRIKFLNDPLNINDFHMANQLPQIIPFLNNYVNFKKELFISGVTILISFFLVFKIIKIKLNNIWTRIGVLILSVLILTSPYLNKNLFDKVMSLNRIVVTPWYRLQNCQNNGMLLCYVYDLQFIKQQKLANYSKIKIEEIMQQASTSATLNNNQIKPTVIVILSESLWDTTRLPNVKFSPDPISNIRKDIKGNFISPSLGGGTANVEFEFVTGLSNYLFDQESYPYSNLIKKNIPSIFTVFKDNQYPTTVIHPYTPQFYNRKTVYKYLGLDKFTSIEDMPDAQMAGPFVSDKYFMDQILKQYNSTNSPQFIFGISMQNHDIYEANRYKNNQIKITGNLKKIDKDTLQTYAEGINLTDKAYVFLKSELEKHKDRPTIVVMFGDHLPFLGDDYSVYQQGGLAPSDENNWTQKNKLNMHTTPLTIWSNYQINTTELGNISPDVLGNEIFDLANISPEYQFKFTSELRKKVPYLTKSASSDLGPYQSLIEDYKLVQYDLLFGNHYIKI